ncbi:MAG: 4-(cytidine 5'-diphospho)-2-C-methyl-D-erythritol kinase [Hyphomicrobiaceae bacterium]|nr:4-(cytidine 5'-diphospho)-2-C-methyl-D-erythritol kinase [Hyphomicrobiaceae bacterium]
MPLIREFAPAKINLTLDVLGKRPDGYHEIESLIAFASDVGDVVTLDTAKPVAVSLSGPFAASIAGANLVETTLRLIEAHAPRLQLGAIHLEKNLPVAAGIGGGSADAAAVMRAVRKANLSNESADLLDWTELGLRLGADVPVCLHSHLAWVTGIGETVTPAQASQHGLPVVIANPLVAVPLDKTAQVFRALGAAPLTVTHKRSHMPPAITNMIELARGGSNMLEAAARKVVPAVDEVLAVLSSCSGNLLTRMSGAGPTCFALFRTQEEAHLAANALTASHPQWWVRATTLN